ncbi:MAG TPA: DUF3579 domain-containing protein [Gallionella sp.]|nr:DUF3579 domain-containing protein [Gallionella sp.]
MLAQQQEEWVILGVTLDDEAFDVPNWAERLCGMLAAQSSDNRLSYSDYLHPVIIGGLPAVVMDTSLELADPHAFEIVRKFVEDNRLKSRAGRNRRHGESSGPYPAFNPDRRHLRM